MFDEILLGLFAALLLSFQVCSRTPEMGIL
jgi:hypothetical protein